MFASIHRAWMRAFHPRPPAPRRFDLNGRGTGMLHIVILGTPGGGKTHLAREIWAALSDEDRARTFIESGIGLDMLESELSGSRISWHRASPKKRARRVPHLREVA